LVDILTVACITLLITCISLIFSLFRTYYNWRTLKESRTYWQSWEKRQADVARKIISGMSDEQIVELARRARQIEKTRRRKKSTSSSK